MKKKEEGKRGEMESSEWGTGGARFGESEGQVGDTDRQTHKHTPLDMMTEPERITETDRQTDK